MKRRASVRVAPQSSGLKPGQNGWPGERLARPRDPSGTAGEQSAEKAAPDMPTGYGLEMEWSLPPRSFRRQRFFVRHRRIDGTSYPGFGQPESVMVGQGGRPRHAASGRVRPLSGSTAGVTGASKAAVQGRSGSRGSPLVANGRGIGPGPGRRHGRAIAKCARLRKQCLQLGSDVLPRGIGVPGPLRPLAGLRLLPFPAAGVLLCGCRAGAADALRDAQRERSIVRADRLSRTREQATNTGRELPSRPPPDLAPAFRPVALLPLAARVGNRYLAKAVAPHGA